MIVFFTLALDAIPFIAWHYATFVQLPFDWRWIIVEGVADNVNCTSWCAKLDPRLSNDGTTEYIDLIKTDCRVIAVQKPLWAGKVAMCNAALERIKVPCLLWQVDADELWTPAQIIAVKQQLFYASYVPQNCAHFYCRYFVGMDRYIGNRGGFGNHEAYEWKRVWRFTPAMRFLTHEPPTILGFHEKPYTHRETEAIGAVFNHYAYATRRQMEFKAKYYSGANNPNAHLLRNCVEGWERLQAVTQFPVKLKDYLPWVDDKAMVVHV